MTITQRHFGGHLVLDKDMIDDGGPYQRFSDQMEMSSYRYPGGGVTEVLSLKDGSWDAIFGPPGEQGDPDRVVTVSEAFDFAAERGAAIRFVLPTEHFLTEGAFGERFPDPAAIDEMMTRVDEMLRGVYGKVTIETFEIGNEYWFAQSRMTAQEYGRIANHMAKELQDHLDAYRAELGAAAASWDEPAIAVQSGAFWKTGVDETKMIIDELDAEARAAIDVAVAHNYPDNFDEAGNRDRMFAALAQFKTAPGFSDVESYISEWNIYRLGDDKGLLHASSLIETFDTMVEHDVDLASVWGTQYKALQTRLAYMSNNAWDGVAPEDVKTWLTPAGEVYRMMSRSLVGTDIVDKPFAEAISGADPATLSTHAYAGDGKVVVFISSRSAETIDLDVDLGKLAPGYGHLWAERLGVIDNPATGSTNEGDPASHLSRPYVETLNQDEIVSAGGAFRLQPYEILRLEFSTEVRDLRMEGQDQVVDPAANYDDHLAGWLGNDTLRGHFGNDRLEGMEGRDILDGGEGGDTLLGGAGSDILLSGDGEDRAEGGAGSDILIGEAGKNLLLGGAGTDLLFALGGANTLTGGAEENHFLVSAESDTVITDFDFDTGSSLSFLGRYDDAAEVMSRTEAADWTGSGSASDLVIHHDEGWVTVLLGAAGRMGDLEAHLFDAMPDETRLAIIGGVLGDQTTGQVEEFSTALGTNLADLDLQISGVLPDPGIVSPPPDAGPAPEDDPENEKDDDKNADAAADASCFVATASYGDPRHPDVAFLRGFRDRVLLPHPAGRMLLRLYWIVGPELARHVRADGGSGAAFRRIIAGLVRILKNA
ncbi:calcium-binding protein [Defluviimonas salinarum]|uniref:Calcium-binding protein n=1 Tax=Defluviimonas salinarum TaxID=2992147 RepID=A0ABT3J4B9_9RHOB|nr:calcium-binding protein [Defluviimonas salinarum]MCW3782541.1 hypothetical protein [Defluviimonas salinarum]